MTKVKSAVITADQVTPEFEEKVKEVLAMRAQHKLSTSKIYEVHNELFGLKETPEACPSCLRSRGDAISAWYSGYLMGRENGGTESAQGDAPKKGKKDAPKLGEYQRPEGAVDYPVNDSSDVIVFTPKGEGEDANKGTVTLNDGTYVKPGKYQSGDFELSVAVGGKATLTNSLL